MPAKFIEVEKLYEENKELKRDDVKALQEWMKMQPHLPTITEREIILFLHSCYYSNEATKKCIDNFYSVRTHCPEIFKNPDPRSEINLISIRSVVITALPILTKEGYGILYSRLYDTNPDFYDFNVQLKIYDMQANLWLRQVGCLKGHVVVMDMQGGTLAHFSKVSLSSLKKGLFYVQEALPIRLKAVHFVNPVPFMDKVLSLTKMFLKAELLDLLHVHSQKDSVLKYVPPECLPNESGGTLGPLSEIHDKMMDTLEDNREIFLQDEKLLVDESKRPGKPKNSGELFGMEGTFKKLELD